MVSNEFCVTCGKEGKTINALCQKCFLKKKSLFVVPEKILVPECRKCNRIEFKGNWHHKTKEVWEKIVLSNIKAIELKKPQLKTVFEELNEKQEKAIIELKGTIEKNPLKEKKEAVLEFRKQLCDSCMKTVSYYHEAVLQLRSEKMNKEMEKELLQKVGNFLKGLEKTDPLAIIIDVKPERKGIDVLIGSKRAAKRASEKLARIYSTKQIVSNTVIGMDKSGNIKKRMYYCIKV